MKISARLGMFASSALCCFLLFVLAPLRADDGQEGGDDVNGSESVHVEIAMTPTASAPMGSSAEVSLGAEDEDGATDATLKLETKGLPADTYTVGVTLKSDGSTVSLGSFPLTAGEAEIEFGSEDEENEIPFPATFNPLDIATVFISNSANVVLFTADLTAASTASSMIRNATVQVSPAPSNPLATGHALLNAQVIKGKTKGMLQVSVQGLPMNLPLTITTNGVAAKNAKTDKAGNLSVTLGPKGKTGTVAQGVNLFNVISMAVHDKFGNLLLTANF